MSPAWPVNVAAGLLGVTVVKRVNGPPLTESKIAIDAIPEGTLPSAQAGPTLSPTR